MFSSQVLSGKACLQVLAMVVVVDDLRGKIGFLAVAGYADLRRTLAV